MNCYFDSNSLRKLESRRAELKLKNEFFSYIFPIEFYKESILLNGTVSLS
ncbi:hypothetical protein LEP1GSC082_2915 [Leptospira kirschneri str. H2]|nr:hypothetical protein LEP1GSC082_2915 [Leptospira kirschneri str. H2]